MNSKQGQEFAEWVNKTDASKVKFYQCDCEVFYNDDGYEEELCKWSYNFDGNYYSDSSYGRYSLLSSIHDYFIWSSQRIQELEAKLAVAKIANTKEGEET
ncbi:hypothetical protein [Microcoleus sp. herbarium2]|uniref:hypothetical protein n=1 Tax=Microcoleus sp. herbarium2 TaxID=3055433 RepID=UPI002FD35719